MRVPEAGRPCHARAFRAEPKPEFDPRFERLRHGRQIRSCFSARAEEIPEDASGGGCRLRHCRGRHPLQRGARMCCWRGSTKARRWPVSSRDPNALPPRGLVPFHPRRWPRAGAGRQFRQCECIYRPQGSRRRGTDREDRGKALGCKPEEVALASTGVIGEPLDATKFEGVLGGLREPREPHGFP